MRSYGIMVAEAGQRELSNPGTTSILHLEENLMAAEVSLSKKESIFRGLTLKLRNVFFEKIASEPS